MSRRTIATVKRPDPHPFLEDPEAPGTCGRERCHLPERNSVHAPQPAPVLPDMTAEMAEARRRAGDRE